MADGYETFEEIERAIAEVRHTEKTVAQKLEADNQARAQLMRNRAGAIRRLAETRVRGAVADGTIDEADRLDRDVAEILKVRQRAIGDLEERQTREETRHRELLAEAKSLAATTSDLEAELDAIGERARAVLLETPAYRDLVGERDTLAEQLENATEKAEQADEDRITKGKPYEADPLFMYLWERNFRGPNYRASGAIRWLDGQVAAHIGYNGARANYAMLNEIPDRLRAHVGRLEATLENVSEEVAALEAKKIQDLIDDNLPDRLAQARTRQGEIDGELSAVETALAETAGQLNRYAEGRDEGYATAIGTLTAFLDHARYNQLVRAARRTDALDDDRIVDDIGDLNRKAEGLDREIKDRRSELKRLERRRDELIKVAAEFRRKSYHRQGSIFDFDFDDDDWEDALKMVVKGGLTVAEWWLRAQARQRWSGRAGDSWRRSSGLPPFNWGGGKRRGGRRKSKRRSGGWGGKDFRTGGGF